MRLVVVDITQHPEIAVRYRIMATPAIAINGKLEFTCMLNEEVLRDRIAQHILHVEMFVFGFAFDRKNSKHLFSATPEKIFRSTDGGQIWEKIL